MPQSFYCTFTAIRRKCLIMNGAGEGNRTLVSGLGSPHSTIEPHPRQAQLVAGGFNIRNGGVQSGRSPQVADTRIRRLGAGRRAVSQRLDGVRGLDSCAENGTTKTLPSMLDSLAVRRRRCAGAGLAACAPMPAAIADPRGSDDTSLLLFRSGLADVLGLFGRETAEHFLELLLGDGPRLEGGLGAFLGG